MAFKIQYNHFEYQIMSFGLSNILETFQKYISKIIDEKFSIFVISYLDNILIYTKNFRQSHLKTIC